MQPLRYCLIPVISLFFFIGACAGGGTINTVQKKREAVAQRRLGNVYFNQRQYSAALRELRIAESLDPQDHLLHNSLGSVYAAKKKYDLAIIHFQKALSLKPDYAPAHNNLGSAYLLKGDWDAAITCLKELTSDLIYATPHYPLTNIGWAYYNKNNYRLAESYYLQALDIDQDYPKARRGLGLTYLAMGKTDAAISQLERVIQTVPEFAQAYMDLGSAYTRQGQKEKAKNAYQRVITLSPENEMGQNATKALNALD